MMTAALKDLTRKAAHHLVVNLILSCRTCKRRESTCVGNRRIREKQMEVLEMAERESGNLFVFGKIREWEMCEWLHPKDQCVGSGFLFLVSRDDPVRTSKSAFCLIVLLFQVCFILFWFLPVSSRKRGFSRKWKSKIMEKKIFRWKKINKHTFSPMKIKIIDLRTQIEVRKLIFIMNFSVLDFFKFASRMPQTAQILVSTFKIFRGSMPPDPPRYFLFFFPPVWVIKFLFFSTLIQWLSFGCCRYVEKYAVPVPEYILLLYQNIYIYIYIFFFFFFFFTEVS